MARSINIQIGREPRAYARTVQESVGLTDSASPILTPGAPSSTMSFGFATHRDGGQSYEDAINRTVPQLGTPRAYRYFFGTNALSWPLSGFGTWENKLEQVVSWKPYPPSSVTNGSRNSAVDAWLAKLPTNRKTWFCCFDHEMDLKIKNGNYTAADACAAWNYLANRVKQFGNPMVKTVLILTGFDVNTRFPWVTPYINQGLCDTIVVDPYGSSTDTTYAKGLNKFRNVFAACDTYFPGLPVGVGETAPVVGPSDQESANWLQGAVDAILERPKVSFALYFNIVGTLGDHTVDNRPLTAKVWRDATAATA